MTALKKKSKKNLQKDYTKAAVNLWRAKVPPSTVSQLDVAVDHEEGPSLSKVEPQQPRPPKEACVGRLRKDSEETRRVIRRKLQELPSLSVVKLMNIISALESLSTFSYIFLKVVYQRSGLPADSRILPQHLSLHRYILQQS
jgi:hypothetical protein